MKIVVITGSGRRMGTSSYLAEEFIRGAKENGNEVFRYDTAFMNMSACIGCNTCRKSNHCIYNDDFEILANKLIDADEVVWVTPIYFMTVTAQLKIAIDRMYQLESHNGFRGNKKYIILATAWDSNPNVFNILIQTIDTFSLFLRWEKVGQLLVGGVDTRGQIKKGNFGKLAYELGRKQ